jgi:microsomal dipeptidase-like Zn-dependent dipeptidase
MKNFQYADLHCHPNLKAFGHSFDSRKSARSDIWSANLPAFFSRKIHRYIGVTKFTQTDFTTLARSRARIVLLSLYPLEKGYFISKKLSPTVAALVANWSVELGYNRVKYLQRHTNYFKDLQDEYEFVLKSRRRHVVDNKPVQWELTNSWAEVEALLSTPDSIAVIITIEGAHVFNAGLEDYGVAPDEDEILSNIRVVKQWAHVPAFVGLAHNFNNDLCGHARSLHRLGSLVDQEKNLNVGLTELGVKVIHALLDDSIGKRIFIDMKHMSLQARKEYFKLINTQYNHCCIPFIVSHGSVNGLSLNGKRRNCTCPDIFNESDLNFFDEEIIAIARSGGIFGLQMDMGNNVDARKVKLHPAFKGKESELKKSARIIWCQIQYIAELLDSAALYAWDCVSIGSDFDGNINPLPGILTAADFEPMAKELILLAGDFLSANSLLLTANKVISADEIVEQFLFTNTVHFLKRFY